MALRQRRVPAEGDIPKLFTYPTTGSGPHSAVIVMPGGGFTSLKMDQEGADEAKWLAARGVAAFVLEYDSPPPTAIPRPCRTHPAPSATFALMQPSWELTLPSWASGDSPRAGFLSATSPLFTRRAKQLPKTPSIESPIDRTLRLFLTGG